MYVPSQTKFKNKLPTQALSAFPSTIQSSIYSRLGSVPELITLVIQKHSYLLASKTPCSPVSFSGYLSTCPLNVESSSGHGARPSFLFTLLLMLSRLWDRGADNACSDHSISLLPAYPNPFLACFSIRCVTGISDPIFQTESWCPPTLRWSSYTASRCISFLWLL